jgi:hypothetical protein
MAQGLAWYPELSTSERFGRLNLGAREVSAPRNPPPGRMFAEEVGRRS